MGGAVGARDLCRHFARDRANLPFETPHASLVRVLRNRPPDRTVLNRDLVGIQAVFLHLPRNQILARDVQLLLFAVAGERDHLHAIVQRRMNRPELIRSRDKEHPREIDVDLEIMVAE